MLLLESQEIELPQDNICNIYLAPVGEAASLKAAEIATHLREEGVYALFDVSGRGIKAQMKYANKIGAEFVAVIGDDELVSGELSLKNMETGVTTQMKLDSFAEDFCDVAIKQSVSKLSLDGDEFKNLDVSGINFNSLFGGKA